MRMIMVVVVVLVWEKAHVKVEGGSCGDAKEWNTVQRSGVQFEVNGSPFYVNGFNAYWLVTFAADNSSRPKVTQLLQQAAAAGFTVGRTWAFNDAGWRALQISPGVYDENVFQALDFVITEAKKNRIRLILSLSNNWNDYGGKAQYVKWGRSAGLNLATSENDNGDAFFSDSTLRTYFKAHIKTVLTRVNTLTNIAYKDDPTIFGWELMNEPRCLSDPSGDTLQGWIQEMATYVKSIDPKHLLEIGGEGFYGPSTPDRFKFNPNTFSQQTGTDFIRNHGAFGIDFASTHIYADSWISRVISPIHLSFVRNWTKAHIDDCQEKLKMPIIFVEYGLSDQDQGYNVSYRESFVQTVYDSVLESAGRGGAGGGSLLWQLFAEGMENMNDGYEIVLSNAPSTTTDLIRRQSLSLNACT